MKNLSFKFKLVSLCVFLCLIGALIGLLSFQSTLKLEKFQMNLTENIIPRSEILSMMDVTYQKVRIEVRTLGLADLGPEDEKLAIEASKKNVADYDKYSGQLREKISSSDEKALFQNLETNWLSFKKIGLRAIELAQNPTETSKKELAYIFSVECPQGAAKFQEALDAYNLYIKNEVHQSATSATELAEKTNHINLFVTLAGIIIGLFAGIYLASKISASIREIATKLSISAQHLKGSSEQAITSATQLSEASIEQAASSQETSASLEEVSSMIEATARNSGLSKNLVESSLDEVSKGKVSVDKMISSMKLIDNSTSDIMAQIEVNNEKMNEIVIQINEIESKTKIINDIVFQTKLLSFNASVEAARAGEAGKGFAVVAEEVGNLAAMSGRASVEIGSLIKSSVEKVNLIAADSKHKIKELIEQAKHNVNSGGDVAIECGNIFETIIQSVNSLSNSVSEISVATAEQAKGVSEIKEAVRQIDDTTQSNTIISEKSAESARELAQQSESLASLVQSLVITINGATSNNELSQQGSDGASHHKSHKDESNLVDFPQNREDEKTPHSEDKRFKEI